tara:strand:+ start:154 stop:549 length:396 start_codon:yes stop_codon:yes gene_type:complete
MESTKEIYDRVSKQKKQEKLISIEPYSPVISDKDKKKGFIKRFFVARFDDKVATEVSEKFINEKFKDLAKGLYKKVEIRWYIKEGVNEEREDEFIHGGITAHNLNVHNSKKAQRKLKQIWNTIKDFLQFVG